MPNVIVSWIFPEEVHGRFAHCVADMLLHDRGSGHIAHVVTIQSSPRIAEARSRLADEFSKVPDVDWLFMIDSDMTFEADVLDRMLAVADPVKVPILGGLCFSGGRGGTPYPTIYREVSDDGRFVGVDTVTEYPENTLLKVGATGAACLLIHKRVFLAMSQPYPKGFGTLQDGTPNPYPWFAEGITAPNGIPFGEDVIFCRRAAQLGIPVHVHTGIKFGHMKSFELNEAEFFRNQTEKATSNGSTRAERRRAARQHVKAVAHA